MYQLPSSFVIINKSEKGFSRISDQIWRPLWSDSNVYQKKAHMFLHVSMHFFATLTLTEKNPRVILICGHKYIFASIAVLCAFQLFTSNTSFWVCIREAYAPCVALQNAYRWLILNIFLLEKYGIIGPVGNSFLCEPSTTVAVQ